MLAAIALTWATALTAAPATAAAHAGRASAESYVPPTVRYLWAGSNTFDFSLDDGATVQSGYYQSVSPPPWAAPWDLDSGTDVQNTVTSDGDVTTVAQRDRFTGDAARFALPKGQVYRASTGWSVVVGTGASTDPLRVWRAAALLPLENAIAGRQGSAAPPLLAAVSATDHVRRTVFDNAQSSVAVAQDGSALAAAEDEAGAWQVHHLIPGGTAGITTLGLWSLLPPETP